MREEDKSARMLVKKAAELMRNRWRRWKEEKEEEEHVREGSVRVKV